MAYDLTDPRATLSPITPLEAPAIGLVTDEQLGVFHDVPPQIDVNGERSWFLRGCHFVLIQSDCAPNTVLQRIDQLDEYVILLPDANARARVTWQGETLDVSGPSLAFIPAGTSRVELPHGGRVTRLFTSRATDLVAVCPNAKAYAVPRENIPPFAPWPDPMGGWKIRVYSLDVPPRPGRFGRIFRCTTFMINVFEPMIGPRDPSKLSPHHHDDFEQCSLLLDGKFTHHLRWPWTTDLADWRADMHVQVGAPSAMVIPPPVIHTSQATGLGNNNLVDIFCPPRVDFSKQDNWVINASDYPMPG